MSVTLHFRFFRAEIENWEVQVILRDLSEAEWKEMLRSFSLLQSYNCIHGVENLILANRPECRVEMLCINLSRARCLAAQD